MREDLQIDFFRETFFGRFFFGTLPRNVSIQNPPPPSPKKRDFFSTWIGLFEICFRSSKMTDRRSCPTGWAYIEIYPVQRGHAKLKPTTNYQLQKSILLKSQRKTQKKTPNVYRTFLGRKIVCLASSLNNIKAGQTQLLEA